MKPWNSVTSRAQVSTRARNLVKSVKGDLSLLNQSQRDMVAAVAVRDQGLSIDEAAAQFDVPRSSLGFARTILRFTDPQLSALVLDGHISVHKLDALRRSIGATRLTARLLSMSTDEIRAAYVSKSVTKVRYAEHTRSATPALTPRQLAAQKGGRARWAKYNSNKKVTGLPQVDSEVLSSAANALRRALARTLSGNTAEARGLITSVRKALDTI